MPKMKTHRGAAKRFGKTGSGKVKRHKAYHSHLLECKSPKQKRHLRQGSTMSKADQKNIAQLIPYK
ncbi:MAG: 50S ribosomal protein L35 [Methylocystaceae bacterium]